MRRATAQVSVDSGVNDFAAEFAADVRYYLMQSPRQLPSRYLYDELGSALFEAICRLPWYRITRAEERLLAGCGTQVLRSCAPVSNIVELGPGSGEKLRLLLERRESTMPPLQVHLVDLSSAALDASTRLLEQMPGVRVRAHEATYETGLQTVTSMLPSGENTLVLFLGSNIGNFDLPYAREFLRSIRRQLRAGDALLLGTDLVKPERELQLAYDDPLEVTAAFNRNLLVRINRELGGDFDIDQFSHRAVWNSAESRIEMHLVANRRQEIHVAAAQIAFTIEKGESIWTESSYKYQPDGVVRMLTETGFQLMEQWIDREDGFALTLVRAD